MCFYGFRWRQMPGPSRSTLWARPMRLSSGFQPAPAGGGHPCFIDNDRSNLECGGKRGSASATPLFLGAAEPAVGTANSPNSQRGAASRWSLSPHSKRPADGSKMFHVRSVNETGMRPRRGPLKGRCQGSGSDPFDSSDPSYAEFRPLPSACCSLASAWATTMRLPCASTTLTMAPALINSPEVTTSRC